MCPDPDILLSIVVITLSIWAFCVAFGIGAHK